MNNSSVTLDSLKLNCREVALGNLPWESLLSSVSTWLGADRAMMLYTEKNQPYNVSHSHNFDIAILNKYNGEHNTSDPRMPLSKLTKPGQTRTGQQYIPNHQIEHTDYFHLVSRKNNIKDSIHSVLLDDPLTGRQAISFHRSFKDDFFEDPQIEKMQALLPHLIDAYQYTKSIVGRIVPGCHKSCNLLIDEKLRTMVLNGKPINVLAGCKDLSWNGEHLRPKNNVINSFLLLALRQAKKSQTAQCRFEVSGPLISEKEPYIQITVSPRPMMIDWLPGIEDMVMINIIRADDHIENNNTNIFCEVFKLTKAESRVLHALLEENNLRHAESKLQISYETIRWHLKNICSKTGYAKRETLLRAVLEMNLSNAVV